MKVLCESDNLPICLQLPSKLQVQSLANNNRTCESIWIFFVLFPNRDLITLCCGHLHVVTDTSDIPSVYRCPGNDSIFHKCSLDTGFYTGSIIGLELNLTLVFRREIFIFRLGLHLTVCIFNLVCLKKEQALWNILMTIKITFILITHWHSDIPTCWHTEDIHYDKYAEK